MVGKAIEDNPIGRLFYSDKDKISTKGMRFDSYFKPDFSLINLRSQNKLNHITAYRTRM